MKILQIVPSYPPKVGGVENHVFELTRHLRMLGHTVYVMTSNLPPLNKGTENNLDIRLPVLHNLSGKWGEIPICPSIFTKLAGMQPDIVHLHTPPRFFAESAAFYLRFLKSNKIPFVVTYHLHNTSLHRLEKTVWWIHTRTLQRFVLNTANKVVICNSNEKNLIQSEFGVNPEKTIVLPPGVDCDRFAPGQTPLFTRKNPNEKIVMFSGRINPVKGLNFLVTAFDTVAKIHKNVTLIICGAEAGNYKHELKQMAKDLGISSRITFLDPVSPETYPNLLASCDIFVLPSLSESWPISIAEALSMEKAVIATNVGGVTGIIKNNQTGLIVNPSDSAALAQALNRLIENPSLESKLAKNGREYIVGNFDWNVLAARFEALYQHVLGQHREKNAQILVGN
jgi:glycosyltransferase involved in cell wall biosynthesis